VVPIPSKRRRANKARAKPKRKQIRRAASAAKPRLPVYRLKHDMYRKRRGNAKLIDIYCANCGELALIYQNDAPKGMLRRCYIDRIFWPPKYEELQHARRALDISAMPNLVCLKCGTLIGTPMLYAKPGEQRLAYRMVGRSFTSKASTHAISRGK
jgi:ribosomal protein S27E